MMENPLNFCRINLQIVNKVNEEIEQKNKERHWHSDQETNSESAKKIYEQDG